MPSNASNQFNAAMRYVDQLIEIHAKLQKGKGRRYEQEALHRAGVVMVIAAWETYVENLLAEGFSKMEADALNQVGHAPPPNWVRQVFQIRRTEIQSCIKRFNTPDATGVRDLYSNAMGFNTWEIWSWVGIRQWSPDEMRKRLNSWLQIRHTIAHGAALPKDIDWIKGENGRPRLTLNLVRECKRFFHHLIGQTDDAFAQHLRNENGLVAPW